jgi:short-subunit dehydrogenase
MSLDVTDQGAVRAIVDAAERQGRPISLLVANAGINASGVAEEMPLELGRAVFETNFWGVVHAARAVLPGMRQRRHGTILVTGSLAGLVAPPGEAYYAASKHALEGFLESLAHEVAPFGVEVRLAEPGFIQTELARSAPEVAGSIEDYAQMRAALLAHWQRSINGGMSATQMAQRMIEWALHGHGLRQRFGSDAIWVARLKRYLPEKAFTAGVRRRFGLRGSGLGDQPVADRSSR